MYRKSILVGLVLALVVSLWPSVVEARAVRPKVSMSGDRYSKVEATIRRENLRSGTDTNSASRAYVQTLGCRSDHAGHIIAKQLGGEGSRHSRNIFPIDPSVNSPTMLKHENVVRDLLKERDASTPSGYKYMHVLVTVTFTYSDSERPNRPTQLKYKILGVPHKGREFQATKVFRNVKPRVCENDETDARKRAAEEARKEKQAEQELKTLTRRARELMETMDDLRTAGGEAVDELVEMICELDLEERSDPVTRTAERAADQLRRKLEDHFDDIDDEYAKVEDVTLDLLDDPFIGDAVTKLYRELDRKWDLLVDAMESETFIERGRSSPLVQAKFQYNYRYHATLQRDRSKECDSAATARIRGSDCVSLTQCTVWEFGPDSESTSDLRARATRMARNANSTYRNRAEAAHCFGPGMKGFTIDIDTYRACKP